MRSSSKAKWEQRENNLFFSSDPCVMLSCNLQVEHPSLLSSYLKPNAKGIVQRVFLLPFSSSSQSSVWIFRQTIYDERVN
jgi:hypothetical protein